MGLPKRAEGNLLFKFSKVINNLEQSPVCKSLNFQQFKPMEAVPVITWPTRRTAIEAELQPKLLFREGQSRARPVNGRARAYSFVGPFILGAGSVLIIVIVFVRVSRRRSVLAYPTVPAHL